MSANVQDLQLRKTIPIFVSAKKDRIMKKLILLIVIIAIVLVGVMTCPQKDAHTDALMKLVNVALDTELSKHAKTEEEMGIAMFGSILGSGIAEFVIDKKLMVDNYVVCSIGRVLLDGEEKVVSVGCFNHVFTMPEDKLKEELKKSF